MGYLESSLVILRDCFHDDEVQDDGSEVSPSRRLRQETFIPSRLLKGVLPQALLESHRFWQVLRETRSNIATDSLRIGRKQSPFWASLTCWKFRTQQRLGELQSGNCYAQ